MLGRREIGMSNKPQFYCPPTYGLRSCNYVVFFLIYNPFNNSAQFAYELSNCQIGWSCASHVVILTSKALVTCKKTLPNAKVTHFAPTYTTCNLIAAFPHIPVKVAGLFE